MASELKAPCMYIIVVGQRFCHHQSGPSRRTKYASEGYDLYVL